MSEVDKARALIERLEEEKELQVKKGEELEKALIDVKKSLEEKDEFKELVKELKQVAPSNIGVVMLYKERKRKETLIREALPNSQRDAAMILSGSGGFLGSRGNKEAGIPAGSPMETPNVESVNMVLTGVPAICKEKKASYDFVEWDTRQQRRENEIKLLRSQIKDCLEKGEHVERIKLEVDLVKAVQAMVSDSFDPTDTKISEEWIRKECPDWAEALDYVRLASIWRTQTVEQRAYERDEVEGTIKNQLLDKKGGRTSTDIERSLERMQFEDDD